jgi:transcriptional regulator with XRE-family HTH domain
MSSETGSEVTTANSPKTRLARLADLLRDRDFRRGYLTRQFKAFLAAQIRGLRGDRTQAEFGQLIGKTQSVVSRLENEHYGQVNIQTLLEIALKLDVALIVRFVDYPTFLNLTRDPVANASSPRSYDQAALDQVIRSEEASARNSALSDIFVRQNSPDSGQFSGELARTRIAAIRGDPVNAYRFDERTGQPEARVA